MPYGADKPGTPAGVPAGDQPYGADTPVTPVGVPAGEHEIVHVDDRVVACDGGSIAGGHPRVWLRIVHQQTFCPWCSRIFVLTPAAGDGEH